MEPLSLESNVIYDLLAETTEEYEACHFDYKEMPNAVRKLINCTVRDQDEEHRTRLCSLRGEHISGGSQIVHWLWCQWSVGLSTVVFRLGLDSACLPMVFWSGISTPSNPHC